MRKIGRGSYRRAYVATKDPSLYDLARNGDAWAQGEWERRSDAALPVNELSKVKCGICGKQGTRDWLDYIHPEFCK